MPKIRKNIGGMSFDGIVIKSAREKGGGILRQVGETIEYSDGSMTAY